MSMATYTVYEQRSSHSTQDPAEALQWARSGGPDAFVTERWPGHGPAHVVWTPETDRKCGELVSAVINKALLAVSNG